MLRILVVEDSKIFRKTLRESLQMSFPEIVMDEATNGDEALQKVKAFHPDLILMDLRLPGESGLGLTQKIKAVHPDINIFILTSYDTQECQMAASRCGADRFIAKDSFRGLEKLIRSYFQL